MNIVLLSNLRKLLPEISLLSLILSSTPLRKAPQKVLNEVYMTQDINQETMKYLVRKSKPQIIYTSPKMNQVLMVLGITSHCTLQYNVKTSWLET